MFCDGESCNDTPSQNTLGLRSRTSFTWDSVPEREQKLKDTLYHHIFFHQALTHYLNTEKKSKFIPYIFMEFGMIQVKTIWILRQ